MELLYGFKRFHLAFYNRVGYLSIYSENRAKYGSNE